MSVIIKGVSMPDKCMGCTMLVGTFCQVLNIDVDPFYDGGVKRNENCPLIELPEHHGRLIDADRLMRVYEDRLEKVADRYGVDSSEAGILSGAMKLLMIELGIIEAE